MWTAWFDLAEGEGLSLCRLLLSLQELLRDGRCHKRRRLSTQAPTPPPSSSDQGRLGRGQSHHEPVLLLDTGHLCQLTRRKGAKTSLGRGWAPASSGDGGHRADLGCSWGNPVTQTEGWEEMRPGAPEASARRPGRHARCEQRTAASPLCGLGSRWTYCRERGEGQRRGRGRAGRNGLTSSCEGAESTVTVGCQAHRRVERG